jgi:hypothetical protein
VNLNELLYSETQQLSDELGHIDDLIRDAAMQNDTRQLTNLAQRKRHLPELIFQAKVRDIADQINAQRTRLGVFQMDFDTAFKSAVALGTELPTKLSELEKEKQRLLDEAHQALADKESLQFAVQIETAEFERLKKQRQSLLLSKALPSNQTT